MSKNIFIATTEPYSGKSIVALGLVNMLLGKAKKVGYFKPIIDSDPEDKKDGHIATVIGHFDLAVNYSDTAETYLATPAGLSSDFTFWQAGTRTVWTPVQNLDLSVDVMYNNINTSSAPNGLNRGLPVDDQGWFAGIFRAQRNFYP